MNKGKTKSRMYPIRCIAYLSTEAEEKYVVACEDRQLKYIREYAKAHNIEIARIKRRNILGQYGVNCHFIQMVEDVRRGFVEGIVITNMKYLAADEADACRKIIKMMEAGGVIYSVDDGELFFSFKEVPHGKKKKSH